MCGGRKLAAAASGQPVHTFAATSDQPVPSAAAAPSSHCGRTVHCDGSECYERTLHGDSSLQLFDRDAELQPRLHAIDQWRHHPVQQQRVDTGRPLHLRQRLHTATATANQSGRPVQLPAPERCQRDVQCGSSVWTFGGDSDLQCWLHGAGWDRVQCLPVREIQGYFGSVVLSELSAG